MKGYEYNNKFIILIFGNVFVYYMFYFLGIVTSRYTVHLKANSSIFRHSRHAAILPITSFIDNEHFKSCFHLKVELRTQRQTSSFKLKKFSWYYMDSSFLVVVQFLGEFWEGDASTLLCPYQ